MQLYHNNMNFAPDGMCFYLPYFDSLRKKMVEMVIPIDGFKQKNVQKVLIIRDFFILLYNFINKTKILTYSGHNFTNLVFLSLLLT